MDWNHTVIVLLVFNLLLSTTAVSSQQKATGDINKSIGTTSVASPYLGEVKPHPTNEIKASNWIIGCENLDRDFADYDLYKEYQVPLGTKRLRFQGGWAKTETAKGNTAAIIMDKIKEDEKI